MSAARFHIRVRFADPDRERSLTALTEQDVFAFFRVLGGVDGRVYVSDSDSPVRWGVKVENRSGKPVCLADVERVALPSLTLRQWFGDPL